MKILLSPDKFRGSLSAPEVCEAMAEGIRRVSSEIEIIHLPMADGGEGTLDLLLWYSKGTKVKVGVLDPLFREIEVEYGISGDQKTAFIEMARASGLSLLKPEERNPLKTTTFGTGQIIRDAIEKGVENIILGIGGSATNDAGIGMASALGWVFYDENDEILLPIGENLKKIHRVEHNSESNISFPKFQVACDVTNPLYGKNGAAYIYAPQKGADENEVEILDEGLRHLVEVLRKNGSNTDISSLANQKGAGAAGGLGFGMLYFMGAELKEGVKLLMEFCDFDSHLSDTDLILTGEGKIDYQTLQGKLINGITNKASKYKIPVIAICGTLDVPHQELNKMGVLYATSILSKPMTLDDAMKIAYEGVRNSTYNVINLLQNIKS